MSDKQLSPIQTLIAYYKKAYNFYSEGNPKKEVYKEELKLLYEFLKIEKKFAEDAFNCGMDLGCETETYGHFEEDKQVIEIFPDYYKKYEL